MADFSLTTLLSGAARGNSLQFRDETYLAKTRVMADDPNFNRFSMIHPCDGRTDRRTNDQRTGNSMIAR